jgi:hypothetical protein
MRSAHTQPSSQTDLTQTGPSASLLLAMATHRWIDAAKALDVAKTQYAERPIAGRAHTVTLFEARLELAARYLERATIAAARSVQ